MVQFGAHQLPPPVLQERQRASLCSQYLQGYCSNGNSCTDSHDLCRVVETDLSLSLSLARVSVDSAPNFISNRPRTQLDPPFDSDGPGFLSLSGARHNNDHINIQDIRILPTTDEILSGRPPFVPSKSHQISHVEGDGQPKLVDALFRMLRYESTEMLADVSYRAGQMLFERPDGSPAIDNGLIRQETPRGSRFSLFRDVKFEDFSFDERCGLIVRVSYWCPPSFRGHGNMSKSGFLERGMLVALVGLDADHRSLSVTFFEVHLRQSTEAMLSRGGKGIRASVQLSFAQKDERNDFTRILLYKTSICRGEFVLVEFPNVLLASFSSCLKRLQNLYNGNKLPFAPLIAPSFYQATSFNIQPPAYARQPGFSFNLSNLRRPERRTLTCELRMSLEDVADEDQRTKFMNRLGKETTLDEGQSVALIECLTRELAFTQGPPGTGKTYLGVALVKAILASQPEDSQRPIIAVCMTNHALDSFLEDLKNEGITSIARLGGGSKKEWTKPHLLKELSRKMKVSRKDRHETYTHRARREALFSQGTKWCAAINGERLDWHVVKEHLASHYPSIYDQFSSMESADDGSPNRRLARKAIGFIYHCWSQGADIVSLPTLSEEFGTYLGVDPFFENNSSAAPGIIQALFDKITTRCRQSHDLTAHGVNIWSMSLTERHDLLDRWKNELGDRLLVDQLVELQCRHFNADKNWLKGRDDRDSRCLQNQQVIGLTTTACAAYWDLLNKVQARVVICEEAGEVMEAHTMCTLFPSVEHAIFIGDPLQLRPHVRERNLSLETTIGSHYRLDESLFERLAMTKDEWMEPFPVSKLNLQRRMHPDIADLSRATLYPYLKDHDSTKSHKRVAGMVHRMYWFNHHMPEDTPNGASKATSSFSNLFEVEMVAGLVNYLVSGNEYGLNDIAVLTPYNGQLAALTRFLSLNCSVWLSESDREELIAAGLLSEENAPAGYKTHVGVLDMLRVATIDNFQGEEAKIIIFSAVRSNAEKNVGFLKTENRINVACSRARDGFYVIGNADVVRNVPMWSKIINVFRSKQLLGPRFLLSCSRHPHGVGRAFIPSDWEKVGQCPLLCGKLLSCGHFCKEKCHDPELHSRMKCLEDCRRVHKCGHKCQNACGDPCSDCNLSRRFVLSCGHSTLLPCQEQSRLSEIRCGHVKKRELLSCGHMLRITCSNRDEPRRCTEQCGAFLRCGHICKSACSECAALPAHPPCRTLCKRRLECGHICPAKCHAGACPRCDHCLPSTIKPPKISGPCLGEDFKSIKAIGKRIATLAASSERDSELLANQFEKFCDNVKPGPLSAETNQSLVHERGNWMNGVQAQIDSFKGEIAVSFERNYDNQVASEFQPRENNPKWAFSAQLDYLFHRCRLATLREAMKTASHLKQVPDASERLPAIAEALHVMIGERAQSNIESMEKSISYCEAHSLQFLKVCMRLTKIEFHLISKALDVQDEDEIERDMDKARAACNDLPRISSTLGKAFNHVEQALQAENLIEMPFYEYGLDNYWRRWMACDDQPLKQCANGHVYPNEGLDYCMDCGNEAERLMSDAEYRV
ncbi:P-loop containing nucleoside triphosphate hydrolase protein [Xylona heveae TC161]|uniref:p-loop containing nucleoside triphosphate hydrolase protein n=1 Tax=Xylona heveae (strain CBS 132557 / TC161) TaxID=1328760 RepID=A0A164ZYK9_XYLHT|nr:P-loop containing nucleoside triphosphate hydrolase protein [Xylona heveae TC161]KZF19706.1 P-loop containing nucleoside triphosphate hydrolase protein [Xylona heveae TC161]